MFPPCFTSHVLAIYISYKVIFDHSYSGEPELNPTKSDLLTTSPEPRGANRLPILNASDFKIARHALPVQNFTTSRRPPTARLWLKPFPRYRRKRPRQKEHYFPAPFPNGRRERRVDTCKRRGQPARKCASSSGTTLSPSKDATTPRKASLPNYCSAPGQPRPASRRASRAD